jgi:hypothetical protein
MLFPKYSSLVIDASNLAASVNPHLQQLLDWDSQGVDKDLIEICEHMLHWEGKLSAWLGLTEVDIHDIKAKHPWEPLLQR